MHLKRRHRARKRRRILSFSLALAALVPLAGCAEDAESIGSGSQAIGNPDPGITNPSAAHVVEIADIEGSNFCTGTVLEDGNVLTAAHCFDDRATLWRTTDGTSLHHVRIRDSALESTTGEFVVAGDHRTSAGKRQGFFAWNHPEHPQLELVDIPIEEADEVEVSRVASNDLGVFAVGWSQSSEGEAPFLYGFERTSLTSPTLGLVGQLFAPHKLEEALGEGRPKALLSYVDEGDTHLLVAMEQSIAGVSHSRVLEFEVTQNYAGLVFSPPRVVLANTRDVVAQSLVRLADGTVAVGGAALLPTSEARVIVLEKGSDDQWLRRATIRPPGTNVHLVELAPWGNQIAALIGRGSEASLHVLTPSASGEVGPNRYSHEHLRGHYEFNLNSSASFSPSSIATTSTSEGRRLYVGGPGTDSNGHTNSLVVRYTDTLELDTGFEVNGILLRKKGSQRVSRVQANGETTYMAYWWVGDGSRAPKLTVAESTGLAGLQGIVRGNASDEVRIAVGADLALLTMVPPLTGGVPKSVATAAIGSDVQCLGIGHNNQDTGPITEGTFQVQATGDTEIELVSSSGAAMASGDSGGPCFTTAGELTGVVTRREHGDKWHPSPHGETFSMVRSSVIADFLLTQ